MTVAELIAALQTMPQGAMVLHDYSEHTSGLHGVFGAWTEELHHVLDPYCGDLYTTNHSPKQTYVVIGLPPQPYWNRKRP